MHDVHNGKRPNHHKLLVFSLFYCHVDKVFTEYMQLGNLKLAGMRTNLTCIDDFDGRNESMSDQVSVSM